jgi:hypothetical protein
MRRVDQLITAARTISRNALNSDGTFAISSDEILQYLNDAQDRLQNLLSATKNVAKIFVTQQIIPVVANQESYTLDDRLLMNKQIEGIEFSATGSVSDYVRLEKLNFFNRDTNPSNYPWGYIKRGGQILLQPTPSVSTGSIRVTYERDLDDLDIPRGVVSSVNTTSTVLTDFTLDSTADAYETTTPGWTTQQFCSVVSPLGVRRCYNIPVTYLTNVITPAGTFTYTSLDSQIQVGDIAVFNKYTTTFSQLPDACERYLIHSAAAELFHRDSSEDYQNQMGIVQNIETDIIKALASQTSEIQFIPMLDKYEW